MKKLLIVAFVLLVNIANAQIKMTPELNQKLNGKTKFNDIKNTVLNHYNQKLSGLSSRDSIEQKSIMRQLKMWNRKFWLEEYYTNSDGFVQDKNKIDLAAARNLPIANSNAAARQPIAWINQGPFNGNDGLGRFDKLAFHPTNSNIIFAGSPHGGLFKTTNGGNNWDPVSAFLPALGISGIAIHPTNPDIIYVLTGEANTVGYFGNDYLSSSDGVYKTTDAGVSWFKAGNFPGLQNINYFGRDLIINPINPQILLAATSNGLFRTSNGGDSWINVNSGNNIFDIEFKPTDPNTVYACNSTFMRSLNGGITFTDIPIAGLTGAERVSIAVTPANPAKIALFAGSRSANSLVGVFISTNSGSNFNLVYNGAGNSEGNLFHSYIDIDAVGGQQTYNNTIAISPINENIIVVGGLCVWSSYDNGVSWTQETAYYAASGTLHEYIHPDQHELKYQPSGTLYVANDGGVYKSIDNGDDWEFKSTGLVATQFYHFERENDEYDIWGGAQDNGILEQTGSGGNYFTYYGGDGYDVMTDHNYLVADGEDNDIIYTVNATIFRDNGTPQDLEIEVEGNTSFFGNLGMSPSNEERIYVGYSQGTYFSNDAGSNWTLAAAANPRPGNWCLAVARSNGNVYTAGRNGNIAGLYKYPDENTAVNISPPAPYVNTLKITDIDIHPLDANIVYISIAGTASNAKVFVTTNGGTTWSNWSFNLPNVPIFCIKRDGNDGVYVGTSIGVYYKRNGVSYWEYFSNGLPSTPVTEIEMWPEPNPVNNIVPSYAPAANPEIWISTFGRGIWFTKQYTANCININPLTGNVIGPRFEEATTQINSNQNIYSAGTDVRYNAGQKIVLTNGFKVQSGAKFKAKIAPCGSPSE